MSIPLVSGEFLNRNAPLLAPEPPKPGGERPRHPDRAALTGIICVLKSCTPWEMLAAERGCGSGMTCWRRLRDWQSAWVWDRLHRELLDELGEADQIDWDRTCLDGASISAKHGDLPPGRTRPIAANQGQSGM
jgi:transposase